MPRTKPTSASDVGAALNAFRIIVQALRVASRASERRAGISAAQLFALHQIAHRPGASINDVARLTFTHQSSVSVVVQRLIASGLVVKTPGHDRRRHRLEVTSKGHRRLTRAPQLVQERLIGAIESLPPSKRRALARSLWEVARHITGGSALSRPPMLFEET